MPTAKANAVLCKSPARVPAYASLKITLNNVNIDTHERADAGDKSPIQINVAEGKTVQLELAGTNVLLAPTGEAALEKKEKGAGTLVISDDDNDGSLSATGGVYAAGIGGDRGNGTTNITITGGTITAQGGAYGAGIGGGNKGDGSKITITDGAHVTAGSAGVLKDGAFVADNRYADGEKGINKGSGGAGIGGGVDGDGTDILISSVF